MKLIIMQFFPQPPIVSSLIYTTLRVTNSLKRLGVVCLGMINIGFLFRSNIPDREAKCFH
jgi:hypothetical protein